MCTLMGGAHLPDAQVDFRVIDGLHSSAVNIPDAGLHCHTDAWSQNIARSRETSLLDMPRGCKTCGNGPVLDLDTQPQPHVHAQWRPLTKLEYCG